MTSILSALSLSRQIHFILLHSAEAGFMNFDEVEVFVAPQKIFWMGIVEDNNIKKAQIELLKRDIVLVPCDLQNLESCIQSQEIEEPIILVNLDAVVHDYLPAQLNYEAVTNILRRFKELKLRNVVFHTMMVDTILTNLLRDNGYHLIVKNLANDKVSIPIVLKINEIFTRNNGQKERSYLRVQFYPSQSFRVNLQCVNQPEIKFSAILNDLSMNGLGVLIGNQEQFALLNVKMFFRVKIFLERMVINVDKALLQRKDPKKMIAGFYFNINDPNMIHSIDGTSVATVIHKVIENIFQKSGYGLDLNFQRIVTRTDKKETSGSL